MTANKVLKSGSLANDKRIAMAKKLLHEAINDHQNELNDIRPPLPQLKQSYEEMLATFSRIRGGKLWFPYLGSGLGKGALVELADGSVKYDFICGIGTHYWGHSHPDLLDAVVDAALSDTVMQGHLQQNIDSLELSSLLVEASGLEHCFLTSSGAMANENALKIAFQKNAPANRILAFERCFVGRTTTLSQITDKPAFREGIPESIAVDYLPFFDPKDPQGSTAKAVATLKKYIARYPKKHAIMCLELVQGEGGFYPGTSEFFKSLMEILKEHHIAIFSDEIQAFGRTTELFAFHYFGLQSYVDIVSVGKLSQACATLFNAEYRPRVGLLSQTYTSSTAAIKASLVILQGLINGNYYGKDGKIAKLHRFFVQKLESLSSKHPKTLEGPFGIGSMIAFTVFGGNTEKTTSFAHKLFENGVISFIAGSNPTRVRFLIPVGVVTEEDISKVVHIIDKTLLECEESIAIRKEV